MQHAHSTSGKPRRFFLRRLGFATLGYLAACFAASLTFWLLVPVLSSVTQGTASFMFGAGIGHLLNSLFLRLFLSAFHSAAIFLPLTIVPAAFFIIWSEVRAERRWLAYACAGVGISVCDLLLLSLTPHGGEILSDPLGLACILAAGLAASTTYWSVAGRWAGSDAKGGWRAGAFNHTNFRR